MSDDKNLQLQLQQTQAELKLSQSELRYKQVELEQALTQVQQTQAELQAAQATIAWMQTSKFWKLRTQVLKFKKIFNKNVKDSLSTLTSASSSNGSHPVFDSPGLIPFDSDPNDALPVLSSPQLIPPNPSILLVIENNISQSIPQCLRYRITQKIEQLQAIRFPVKSITWSDLNVHRRLHFCHIVIFYRVPAYPEVIDIVNYAKALNKVVFFEVDDLIFDLTAYGEKIESFRGKLSEEVCSDLLRGAALFRQAMSLCQYAIAATPTLAQKMEEVVGSSISFVHRNGIDRFINNYLELGFPKFPRNYVSIFYGSGTNTHDADFELVASALVQILVKHQTVRLTLVGYLQLPDILTPYLDKIDRINYLTIEPYFEFLSQADINIAPLEPGIFADSKSEVKWLEAAMLKVPSVVSVTQTYLEVLDDGVDAFIAHTPQDWFDKLGVLVSNQELRHTIAQNAHAKAQRNYNLSVMGDNLKHIIACAIHQSTKQGLVALEGKKKKLLFVNVFYPPRTLGGAAVIMKNIVDTLKAPHADYELSVFTCDLQNIIPYELSEYTQNGIHVTALSVARGPDTDWRYQDAQVHDIFIQYLAFNQPDLIHFHCVQHLTASMLEAAEQLAIPYVVTVHDAWWLCDRQFLIDNKGVECDPRQNDPAIAARYTDDINNSILRRRYLAKRLNHAKALLAVSEFQAQLYRLNGFTEVTVNRNGILPQPVLQRTPAPPNRIRLGYAGGISVHKGYYFLKAAIVAADLHNSELTVIDFFMTSGSARHETWGSTLANYIPKLPAERMPEFFNNIDVLVAPSLWPESFGLITREAVLAGLWVVASNKGSLAEDIRPQVDGDVFSPHNIDELVAILKKLDRDPERYQQQRVPEADRIRRIDEQVSELKRLYEAILNEQNVFA